MPSTRIIDVTDAEAFGLIPPCADPGFDHRTCDHWEDADRGSKAARASWLEAPSIAPPPPAPRSPNPFLDDLEAATPNPFAASGPSAAAANPFARDSDALTDNPFAPKRAAPAGPGAEAPRKLRLLGRGLAVFGSFAKVLLAGDVAVAYAQFGPLSAYPRALHLRELYPQLPDAPLPAVITCIATTREGRGQGHARRLVDAVCDDLAGRGFSAVEAYPEAKARPDATSAASTRFWLGSGFELVVDDDRYPVVRRELG
jgi:GNAT superfamily N-acetyltransferase